MTRLKGVSHVERRGGFLGRRVNRSASDPFEPVVEPPRPLPPRIEQCLPWRAWQYSGHLGIWPFAEASNHCLTRDSVASWRDSHRYRGECVHIATARVEQPCQPATAGYGNVGTFSQITLESVNLENSKGWTLEEAKDADAERDDAMILPDHPCIYLPRRVVTAMTVSAANIIRAP